MAWPLPVTPAFSSPRPHSGHIRQSVGYGPLFRGGPLCPRRPPAGGNDVHVPSVVRTWSSNKSGGGNTAGCKPDRNRKLLYVALICGIKRLETEAEKRLPGAGVGGGGEGRNW